MLAWEFTGTRGGENINSHMAALLRETSSLKKFAPRYGRFGVGSSVVESLKHNNLESLDLRGCDFNDELLRIMAGDMMAGGYGGLQHLDIWRIRNVTSVGWIPFIDALAHCPCLETLRLDPFHIDAYSDDGDRTQTDSTQDDSTQEDGAQDDGIQDDGVQDDDVQDDDAQDDGAQDDVAQDDGAQDDGAQDDGSHGDGAHNDGVYNSIFILVESETCCLKTLIFGVIDSRRFAAAADAIACNTSLNEVKFEAGDFCDDACRSFARALFTNTSLKSVSILAQSEVISDKGWVELALGLKKNSTLEQLTDGSRLSPSQNQDNFCFRDFALAIVIKI